MDEKDLPSSSDESDLDFVPKEEDDKSDSGSEVSDYDTSDGEEKTVKGRKRKKEGKKCNKKQKVNKNAEKEEKEDGEEEKKIDIDAIWADFKKDVNNTATKKTTESSKNEVECETKTQDSEPSNLNQKPKTRPVTSGFPAKRGGLSNVLNQIGKKDKMSTLQKSKLDWNNFKKSEGIEEEIKLHNRGKDGYLERQDFLQRTDLRQFEIEKDLRNTRRKF